jgi:glycosyltransferase involved in cell wall biosynthesis
MVLSKKIIVYVVNVDWFFISHRLPLGIEAIERGYRVFLITKDTGRFRELEALGIKCLNMSFDRSGTNPLKDIRVILNLSKIYKKLQPDIIHHVTVKPSIYGTIAARFSRTQAKVINAVSGLGYIFTGNRSYLAQKLMTGLLWFAFSDQKTSFIFQNPDDCAFYKKLNFLSDKNYIIIKGAGIDEKIFRLKESYSKDKIKIVLVARMLKDKGVYEFVKAALLLKKKYEHAIEFILVGGVDMLNPAFISFEDLNGICDGDYIKWLGHQDDIKGIYQNADIVCLPSYREGLPKSLVEAMSIGCPIITTDTIGCRECVEEGFNGFLVPVGDHIILASRIEKLANDKELRIEMGANSRRKMLKDFSLETVIKQTFAFYE